MAQQTQLSVIGIPGQVRSFSSKTPAPLPGEIPDADNPNSISLTIRLDTISITDELNTVSP